jgi:ABC-type glutathione transport system ATPase component
MLPESLLEIENLSKVYKSAAGPIKALNDVSLKL